MGEIGKHSIKFNFFLEKIIFLIIEDIRALTFNSYFKRRTIYLLRQMLKSCKMIKCIHL